MKKEKRFSNINITNYTVFISIFSIIVFTVVSLYFYYKHGIVVSDLKTEIFAFFGVELIALATISITNNLGRKGKEEE